MKEMRYFYDPELSGILPEEEAKHAIRVLRLSEGDVIYLMDGCGTFYQAAITFASNHRCVYRILQREPQEPAWDAHLHLAMAPTKLNDRVEWFAEKATEIGLNEISFLQCRFSERKEIKCERIEKIVLSAVKQSHKAWIPKVNAMQGFEQFILSERSGQKFICHCYTDSDVGSLVPRPLLLDVLRPKEDATVLIGPEGDFSVDEVRFAMQYGYRSVSLGTSRLRTETAALVAVHFMQIVNQRQ